MGDAQRCQKCQGDRLAEVTKDGMAMRRECAGLPPLPSVAERFRELSAEQQRLLRGRYTSSRPAKQH
jgi:hypothetical protein